MVEVNPAPNGDNCGVCGDPFTDNDMRYVDWSTDDDSDTHTGWIHLRCKGKLVYPEAAEREALLDSVHQAAPLPTEANYPQLRLVCRACNLHFIVCTERPESHGLSTMYCPECGQHDARFIMYEATVPGFIFQSVPGEAEVKDIKL